MTTYAVNINMDQSTVKDLSANNYKLYGFKAVQTTANGSPLVWFSTSAFSLNTYISWDVLYNAYTSKSVIKPNTKIVASAAYQIDLRQTLNVTDKSGTGTVDSGSGVTGAISIHNLIDDPFTCGISQSDPSGTPTPMCAFPLFGGGLDVIAPIEKVLFMFATDQINTGTVIEKAFSRGVLVDLTGAPGNTRSVFFDINKGWSWNGEPWAKQVPATSNLTPLLIENSAELSRARIEAM